MTTTDGGTAPGLPLRGHRALITGSTGGLGLAIATAFARAGADVLLHGLESEDSQQARCAELAALAGGRMAYLQADLATERGVAGLIEAGSTALGGHPDVLVNNAVVRHFAPIDRFPTEAWDRALAVNLSAVFHAVRLLLPSMRAAGWGRILNLASVYGSRATTNRIDYVTTKSALLGFTRAVALETLHDGITCNALCPGTVRTPAIESRIIERMAAGHGREQAERDVLAGKQPTGRFVEADNVAALALFLCSAAARDITGAQLPIEGGWLAG